MAYLDCSAATRPLGGSMRRDRGLRRSWYYGHGCLAPGWASDRFLLQQHWRSNRPTRPGPPTRARAGICSTCVYPTACRRSCGRFGMGVLGKGRDGPSDGSAEGIGRGAAFLAIESCGYVGKCTWRPDLSRVRGMQGFRHALVGLRRRLLPRLSVDVYSVGSEDRRPQQRCAGRPRHPVRLTPRPASYWSPEAGDSAIGGLTPTLPICSRG
jgi:hypothetical protein